MPLHAPPQPANVAPGARVAVSPTVDPCRAFAVHTCLPLPQVIPPPVTVPCPVTATLSATSALEPPEKVALTLLAALIVSEHVRDEPLHAPPQLWKVWPLVGCAVSVTFVPADSVVEQLVPPAPQVRPPPVTVPLPVTETLRGKVVGPTVPPEKFAVTLLSPLIVTVQVAPLELVQPLQLVNEPPEPGVAVSVTSWPEASSALQPPDEPLVQAIPPPVTVPFPFTETASRGFRKVPVAVLPSSICSVQLREVPLHAPLHPPKTKPSSGVSTTVSVEPSVTAVVQSSSPVSQSMSSPEMFPPSPWASPFACTVNVFSPGSGDWSKVAITSWSSSEGLKSTLHGSLLQPSQSEKVQPEAGAALRLALPAPL